MPRVISHPIKEYLPATIAGLLRGLTKEQRDDIYIVVVNGALEPRQHHAAFAIEHLIDELITIDPEVRAVKEKMQFVERHRLDLGFNKLIPSDGVLGRIDWTLAARACMEHTAAKFVLMLEDDVFAYAGWFDYLSQFVVPQLGDEWFRVDLFSVDSWNGWETSDAIVLIVICLAITAVLHHAATKRCKGEQAKSDNQTLLAKLLLFAVIFSALFCPVFWLNKMNALPDKALGIHRIVTKICCAQAYMFNRQYFERLLTEVQDWSNSLQVDRLVNKFSRENAPHPSYFSVPSIFQHFGFQTTIEAHDGKTKLSTSFETYCQDQSPRDLLSLLEPRSKVVHQ